MALPCMTVGKMAILGSWFGKTPSWFGKTPYCEVMTVQ